jgi:hypothetical protein
MMGNRLTMFFSLRCLVIKYPIEMLGLLTIMASFTLGEMLRIIEGPVFTSGLNDYRQLSNCMWNMFVTMTTGILQKIKK